MICFEFEYLIKIESMMHGIHSRYLLKSSNVQDELSKTVKVKVKKIVKKMNKLGGAPKCIKCQKAVYFTEQVVGPGNGFYHKTCLTCTQCNKRLDSTSLTGKNFHSFIVN